VSTYSGHSPGVNDRPPWLVAVWLRPVTAEPSWRLALELELDTRRVTERHDQR